MSTPLFDARALAQSGFEALARGDAQGARDAFDQLVASGKVDAASCVGLAHALRGLGDMPGALAAADRSLSIDPRNLRALLFKADHAADTGDARAASSFYRAAVATAPPPERLPADLRAELARADGMVKGYAAQFEAFLQERLLAKGMGSDQSDARFRQSLDLLLGKKQVFVQQPQTYYFPELPQKQFYDRAEFPWFDKLEAATADIRAECLEVMREDAAFKPYVQGNTGRPPKDRQGMQDNPDWSAFYLYKDGDLQAANAARCPRTMAALAHVPLAAVKNRSPSVLFSLLRPGALIPPHHGLINTRLICHLPLIVPPGCGLRVGNDARETVEGKGWLFDDTIEHAAWNTSSETRVILLFEVWKPELSFAERTLVSTMFSAIDEYSGQRPQWSI
jgi:aspartyl/asparaginyl beta-hydroxylase (cupin superfamily)